MVRELEEGQLDDFLLQYQVVLLDVYTTWCKPCLIQNGINIQIEKEINSEKLAIAKMDADKCMETAGRFQIRAIPTLILFKGGELVQKHVGVWDKKDLMNEINALL